MAEYRSTIRAWYEQLNGHWFNCYKLNIPEEKNSFMNFTFKIPSEFSLWRSEKNPLAMYSSRKGNVTILKLVQSNLFSLATACPKGKLFYLSTTKSGLTMAYLTWKKSYSPTPVSSMVVLSEWGKVKWKSTSGCHRTLNTETCS